MIGAVLVVVSFVLGVASTLLAQQIGAALRERRVAREVAQRPPSLAVIEHRRIGESYDAECELVLFDGRTFRGCQYGIYWRQFPDGTEPHYKLHGWLQDEWKRLKLLDKWSES